MSLVRIFTFATLFLLILSPVRSARAQGDITGNWLADAGGIYYFRQIGDEVFGATLNQTGAFQFEATKVGKDTALQQIIQLVQNAQGLPRHRSRRQDGVGHVCPFRLLG